MAIVVTENAFTSKEQAVEEIKTANLWVLELEFEDGDGNPHWHEFYDQVYVLEGTFSIRDDTTGIEYNCGAGTRIVVPPRTVHSELAARAKTVIGISIDPTTMGEDIDLSPALLA